jgi:hypothetical protein
MQLGNHMQVHQVPAAYHAILYILRVLLVLFIHDHMVMSSVICWCEPLLIHLAHSDEGLQQNSIIRALHQELCERLYQWR